MKTKSFLLCSYFVCIVLLTFCFTKVNSSMPVEVNITSNDPTDQGLPYDINVTFTTATNSSTESMFNMIRVGYDKVPIYSIETDKDGRKIIKENVTNNENVAFYQDTKKGAIIQLSRTNGYEGQLGDLIIMRGQYRQGNFTYSIEPTVRTKREATQNDSQSDHRYEIRQVLAPPVTKTDNLNPPPEYHSSMPTKIDSRSSFGSKSNRRRRQSFKTYYIDVTAFLDSTRYSRFLDEASYNSAIALTKIREYYAFIFTGIDLIYQNFQSTKFQLRVRLTKIVIFKTSNDFSLTYVTLRRCPWYAFSCTYFTVVDTVAVLDSFTLFLNSTRGKDLVFPYDHAMLFIGDDMWASTTDILGLAWVKTICRTDGMSSSAIEDTGDYSAILTGAHELGHSLSARHDGTNNSCSTYDRYLMSPSDSDPTSYTKLNPWRFSPCTVSYFESYLTDLAYTTSGLTCLSDTLAVLDNFPDVSHRLLGQEIPAEKQCKLRFGTSSYVCQDMGLTDICPGMYCYNPSVYGQCYSQAPLSGTTCGCGKVCNQGLCEIDSLAPVCNLTDISSNCTTASCYSSSLRNSCQRTCDGFPIATTTTTTTTTMITTRAPGCYDDPTFTYLGDTCRTLDTIYCVYTFINESCCSTCTQRTLTTPGYGCYDDSTFTYGGQTCQTISPSLCIYSYVNQSCCRTCSQGTTTVPSYGCYDDSTFTYGGYTCQTILPSFCIYSFVNQSCCRTCSQGTTTVPSYGCYDDSTFTYGGQTCQTISPSLCIYSYVNQSCCRTCSRGTTTVPNYGCYDDSTYTYYGQTCQDISISLCIYSSVRQSCCRTCSQLTTSVPNNCYDDYTFRYYGLSCQEMSQSYCTIPSVSQSCCSMCHPKTTVPNYFCNDDPTFTYFGLSCQRLPQSYCTIASVSQSCCSLCGPTTYPSTTTSATCRDNPYFYTADGKNCYSAMISSTNYCYNPDVNLACCASCAMRYEGIQGCEYGDRDRSLCSNISSCRGYSHDCCYTCGSRGIFSREINIFVLISAVLVLIYRNISI